MADFKGIENFRLILAFIVPGLIVVYIRSRFVAGRSPSHTEQILSYLVLSLVYYTFSIPFIRPALAFSESWIEQALKWHR